MGLFNEITDMKKHLFLICIIGILFVITLFTASFHKRFAVSKFKSLSISHTVLHVEIAQTSDQITKGLGDRNTLGSDGMLFILPRKQIPQFWMKGMRFNLDFVWIENGTIVALTPNVNAQPNIPDVQLTIYSPGILVDWVLELPEGTIQKEHFGIGDPVHL